MQIRSVPKKRKLMKYAELKIKRLRQLLSKRKFVKRRHGKKQPEMRVTECRQKQKTLHQNKQIHLSSALLLLIYLTNQIGAPQRSRKPPRRAQQEVTFLHRVYRRLKVVRSNRANPKATMVDLFYNALKADKRDSPPSIAKPSRYGLSAIPSRSSQNPHRILSR